MNKQKRENHKSKALEDDCLCSKCSLRFSCFTEERIFSDPIFQGLFEALMAQGRSREEALDEVTAEIKFRINRLSETGQSYHSESLGTASPYAYCYVTSGSLNNHNGKINYTMRDGREVSW